MKAEKKMKPPSCPFGPVKQVLEKNRNVNLTKIDKANLRVYGIARGYEDKVLSALRWLNLIDSIGNVTDSLTKLRITGEEFEKAIKEVIEKSYSDMVAKVPPENSKREELLNYFIQVHNFPSQRAKLAVSFVVGIWNFANLPLSEELKSKSNDILPKKNKFSHKNDFISKSKHDLVLVAGGKRKEFNLNDELDRIIFRTFSDELLKKYSEKPKDDTDSSDD